MHNATHSLLGSHNGSIERHVYGGDDWSRMRHGSGCDVGRTGWRRNAGNWNCKSDMERRGAGKLYDYSRDKFRLYGSDLHHVRRRR